MIKTLWFFLKVAVLIAAAVWLVSQPGQMNFSLLGYDVKMQTGIFLVALVALLLVTLYLLSLVQAIFSVPKKVANYREDYKHKAGYRSLTRGLVAIAAGDAVKASQYSKETKKLLKDDSGLPLLLEAQAARMRGEEALARNRFEALMGNQDTAFLGIRGLMKAALDEGDKAQALHHAQAAYKQYPNQAWVIKMLYALEIKNHHWEEVLKLGKKVEKLGALPPVKIMSDRIAVHLMRHDFDQENGDENAALRELKTAYKLNSTYIPTVTRYAEYYMAAGKNKKAAALVEAAWKENAHPDLADIWDQLSPTEGKDIDKKRLNWFEKLVDLNPQSVQGPIAAARAAMDMEYWGEAKAYLMAAEKIYPVAKIYHMRAVVEQNITHNDDNVENVLAKAGNAMPDKVWTCKETGMVYEEWTAIAAPHDSFNTIIWDIPRARAMENDVLSMTFDQDSNLLIDPAN